MSVSGDLFLQLLVTLITYKASVVCTHLITETQSEAWLKWRQNATCPCDGGSNESWAAIWNQEECYTVATHVV